MNILKGMVPIIISRGTSRSKAGPDGSTSSCNMKMFCLFVCFGALRPKSTAMVMAGQSVHQTTLIPGQA